MPAYAKVYHSSVSEATCGTWDYDLCRNETDCPGLSGPLDHGPAAIQRPGPYGHGHTAAIEVPSMKRGNGSARAGAMRASSWTQILREL